MPRLDDYFVSFCLVQEGELPIEVEMIRTLDRLCRQRLKYWEILYIVSESDRSAIKAIVDTFSAIKNLRITLVRDSTSYYQRRATAASEAIGDVVVLGAFNEMMSTDLIDFAERAMKENQIVMACCKRRWLELSIFRWVVSLISHYRVNSRDLKTIALTRDRLVAVLARSTAAIDLRFEPKRGLDPYLRVPVILAKTAGAVTYKHRLDLLLEIVATSAPRFLAAYASMALIVSLLAMSYGAYAVGVILTRSDVQPGWFSTAISQSGSAAFLSIGLAVVALGIANMLRGVDGGVRDVIVDEIGNISFYEHVHEINVEMHTEAKKATAAQKVSEAEKVDA